LHDLIKPASFRGFQDIYLKQSLAFDTLAIFILFRPRILTCQMILEHENDCASVAMRLVVLAVPAQYGRSYLASNRPALAGEFQMHPMEWPSLRTRCWLIRPHVQLI
jgi:hypothetical protein